MLLGSQQPRYLYVPPSAVSSAAGEEAAELARSAGLGLDEAQETALKAGLSERKGGKWAAFEVGYVMPRQNGKNNTVAARQLGGLYLFGDELQTHTAHRSDACLEQFRRIRPLIETINHTIGNRRLKLKKITETNGQEAFELMSGQRLQFKARSKESGRAFTATTVYLDEAMRLTDLGSLLPTMSALSVTGNPQIWYSSSAPLPKVESDILRSLCRRGRRAARGESREHRLAYIEHCASEDPGPRPDVDEDGKELDEDSEEVQHWLARWRLALVEANHALGVRIGEEFCETERLTLTPHEVFARERLGIFPEDVNATEAAIDEADWKTCAAPQSKTTGPLVLAFDVSVDRKWAQIGVAAASTEGGTHVEIIENRRGTGWVIDRLLELQQAHTPTAIVCHPGGPAGGLIPEAEKAGLVLGLPDPDPEKAKAGKVKAISQTDYTQACEAAYDAIAEHRWRHINQPELTIAATGAGKRPVGDAFVFDRRGIVDISPFLTVTLAAWAFGRRPAEAAREPNIW